MRNRALLEQMSENIQQKYHGLKSKKKEALIKILQEVRCLFSEENETDNCRKFGDYYRRIKLKSCCW